MYSVTLQSSVKFHTGTILWNTNEVYVNKQVWHPWCYLQVHMHLPLQTGDLGVSCKIAGVLNLTIHSINATVNL